MIFNYGQIFLMALCCMFIAYVICFGWYKRKKILESAILSVVAAWIIASVLTEAEWQGDAYGQAIKNKQRMPVTEVHKEMTEELKDE